MFKLKNKKAFTLIELLAVVVILGVIATIAIPNVVSTLDKNKKETFIEDAKKMISSAEYKIRSDTSIDYPDLYSTTVLRLGDLDNVELETSPFDTYYSEDLSFVAIVMERSSTGDYEYAYYAHLVSCNDKECLNLEKDSAAYNRGINLTKLSSLDTSERFDFVLKGADVKKDLINNSEEIKAMLDRDNVNIY